MNNERYQTIVPNMGGGVSIPFATHKGIVQTKLKVPIPISRLMNSIHDCHLNPHYKGQYSKIRAKAVVKEELAKIDAWEWSSK